MTHVAWRQRILRGTAAAVVWTIVALPVEAQPRLRMLLGHGTVTVDAVDMPVQAVLDEWARLGSVTIVNAEVLPAGRRVTLTLTDVPEGLLLDALLGNVAGYLATLRPAGAGSASAYDRIWLARHPATASPNVPRGELTAIDMPPSATHVATEELQAVPSPEAASSATEELSTVPLPDVDAGRTAAERRERVAADNLTAVAPPAPVRPTLREPPTP